MKDIIDESISNIKSKSFSAGSEDALAVRMDDVIEELHRIQNEVGNCDDCEWSYILGSTLQCNFFQGLLRPEMFCTMYKERANRKGEEDASR